MVRIRMTRKGRTHRPFFRINAVDKKTPRDGVILENLGWYDPVCPDPTKQVSLNGERIKHWLAQGAQPSDTVASLLVKHGLMDGGEIKARLEARIAAKKKIADAAAAAAPAEAEKKD